MSEQRTPEWFEKRAGRLTGSRIDAIVTGNATAARKKLVWTLAGERLMGTCAPTYQNAAMIRGIELESEARKAYEMDRICVVHEIDFIVHPLMDYVGVSPDGLVGDDGLLEIKVPDETSLHLHLQHIANGYYAKQYKWQVQHQLWVADRDWCDVASYYPEYPIQPLAVTRVERDQKAIEQISAACEKANAEIEAAIAGIKEAA